MRKLSVAAAVVLAAGAGQATAWGQVAPSKAGQYTGVSHPEQIPVTTSPEGISQPVVYEGAPAATELTAPVVVPAPALKPRAGLPATEPRTVRTEAPAQYEEAALSKPAVHKADAVERDDAAAARADEMNRGFLTTPTPRGHGEPSDERIVTRVAGPSNQLPMGTLLKVRLREELSTGKTHVGQEFKAELAYPVVRDGRVLLPAGSMVSGQVADVHGGKRISGPASITLRPTSVTLPDGTRYGIRAQLIDSELYKSTRVDEEGTLIKKDHAGKTAAVIGLSTGASAATGAVLGGWPGALIGAGVGAGIGTVMWLKKDRQTEMPVDTKMVFSLNSPLVIGAE